MNLSPTTQALLVAAAIALGGYLLLATPKEKLRARRARPKMLREGSRRKSTSVQSLLFPRTSFGPEKAKRWAKQHGYHATKIDVTNRYVRLRQKPPGGFAKLRTVSFGKSGIKAVVGR